MFCPIVLLQSATIARPVRVRSDQLLTQSSWTFPLAAVRHEHFGVTQTESVYTITISN